jgi:hypothetical protein
MLIILDSSLRRWNSCSRWSGRGASHTLLERGAEAAVPSTPKWVIKTSRTSARHRQILLV